MRGVQSIERGLSTRCHSVGRESCDPPEHGPDCGVAGGKHPYSKSAGICARRFDFASCHIASHSKPFCPRSGSVVRGVCPFLPGRDYEILRTRFTTSGIVEMAPTPSSAQPTPRLLPELNLSARINPSPAPRATLVLARKPSSGIFSEIVFFI